MNPTSKRRQRGTQVLELALLLPLLSFLALVVSEGAGFVRAHQVLNNAAREGARAASLEQNGPANGDKTPQIRDLVLDYAWCNKVSLGATPSPSCSGVAPTTTCQDPVVTVVQNLPLETPGGVQMTSSRVTVSCGYELTYLPSLPLVSVPKVIRLAGSAEFRNFY